MVLQKSQGEPNMAATTWNIDTTHSSVTFSIRHLVIAKVRGHFKTFSGSLQLDEADLGKSSVSVEIDAASIDTHEAKRDEHLRSADFFDVAQFPKLSFVSKKLELEGKQVVRVVGDLTIHGVTKEVTLAVEDLGRAKDPWGNQRAAFAASTSINRKDFGLSWNQVLEAGGVMVADKVDISLDVQAVLAAATQAA
jgi:polyisoprenoid-binding protein YceI